MEDFCLFVIECKNKIKRKKREREREADREKEKATNGVMVGR